MASCTVFDKKPTRSFFSHAMSEQLICTFSLPDFKTSINVCDFFLRSFKLSKNIHVSKHSARKFKVILINNINTNARFYQNIDPLSRSRSQPSVQKCIHTNPYLYSLSFAVIQMVLYHNSQIKIGTTISLI